MFNFESTKRHSSSRGFSYDSVYGGVLRYYHIYVGKEHYFGFKFQINEYLGVGPGGGYEEIVDLFLIGVITKLDYLAGSFLYILGLFKVKILNGNMPDIPDTFSG